MMTENMCKSIIMKIITFIIVYLLYFICPVYGQKADKNILKSNDIEQIEKYLINAHPDDPKKGILKKKLIMLKNEAWTKGAKNVAPMAARPLEAGNSIEEDYSLDEEEFYKLMKTKSIEHKERTVSLLNTLFKDDLNSDEKVILVRNKSECKIIVRIEGIEKYNLAVSPNHEDFVIVKKGEYTLKSTICGNPYSSKKNVDKGIIVELNAPSKHSKEKIIVNN